MSQSINADSLLTSRQAGELLQVNASSINKWVEQGHIRAFKTPGGHRRIRARDLVQFLNSRNIPVPTQLAIADMRRLLIVDDDKEHLASMQRLLKPYEAYVKLESSDNGIDALVKVGAFRPHLVVLDMYMPQVDGLEVCRRLKENPDTAEIRVIITSGRMGPALKRKAEEAGAYESLPKPVDLRYILETLGVVLAPALPI